MMRGTLVLVFATLAFVSAAPSNDEVPPALVQTAGAVPVLGGVTTEEVNEAQEAANRQITASGAMTAAGDQDVATSGVNDMGEGVVCGAGEVICPNNVCAKECPAVQADAEGNGHGYTGEFQAYEASHAAPPAVQGSPASFKALAVDHEGLEASMEATAEAEAMSAAGLTAASTVQNKQAIVQNNAANKEKVKKLMNVAAEKAATYKEADHAHTEATNALQEAEKEEQEQEKRVADAKKVLDEAKAVLHKKQEAVRVARTVQQNAQYHAEATAADYEKAKALAIKTDNEVQAAEKRAEMEEKFKEVAVHAVEKEAAAEKAKAEEAAASAMTHENAASGFDMTQCHSDEAKQCGAPGPKGCQRCLHCAHTPEGEAACADCKTTCSHCEKYTPCMTDDELAKHTADAAAAAAANTAHTAAAPPATEADCSDCTDLPQEYKDKGGSCSDCPDWAAAGQCTEPTFHEFMVTNCKKSCGFCGATPAPAYTSAGSGVMPAVTSL